MQSHRQRNVALTSFVTLLLIGFRRFDHYESDAESSCRQEVEDNIKSFFWPRSTSSFLAYAAAASNRHQTANNDESAKGETEAVVPAWPSNYYELLNLETFDTHRHPKTKTLHNRKKRAIYRSKITTSDIKKAYRKQAQLYHPDKAARQNKTKEEATARFAQIAEAYQVLVDPVQRNDYDWELLVMEEGYEAERLQLIEQQKEEEVRRQQKMEQQQQYYGERQHGTGIEDDFSVYDTIKNGASNLHAWKDTLNHLDPWKVFEDFFFQESTMFGDNYANSNSNSYANNYKFSDHSHFDDSSLPQQHRWAPPRVSETTVHQGYDERFGADLFTVLRREEYTFDVNHIGEYYYRILGQDFISGTRVDPYTGFLMQEYYSAVTEPYFVEDGYSKLDVHHGGGSRYGDANLHSRNQRDAATHRASTSKLEVGESFRPNAIGGSESDPWISPNGKYQAILTSTCELQIVSCDESTTMGDADIDSTVIWTSETYIPNVRAHGCYLALNTLGSLVLSVDYGSGIDSAGNAVLWNTPLPRVVPHWVKDDAVHSKQQYVTFRYYTSIDDDGVIAVYRAREREEDGAEGGGKKSNAKHATTSEVMRTNLQMRPILDKLGVIYHRISQASEEQGQSKVAIVWDHLRYNLKRMLSMSPSNDEPSYLANSRDECIYSTSPVGCLAPGRNAIRLTKNIARSINTHLDQFLAALTEPVSDNESYDYVHQFRSEYESSSSDFGTDEDEDLLDTLIRVTGAAGTQLGKAGSIGFHAAQLGMMRGKTVAGKMVGKMKDRLGKHSGRWGERMTEEDEGTPFP